MVWKQVAPSCKQCGSTKIHATSSTQERQVNGKTRVVADVVCENCGHTWWSARSVFVAEARGMDKERKEQT